MSTGQQWTAVPFVSIIIPCYNAEAFVGEAIESALGQTYPNVEVIVIDDGSTDGSLAVIRAYGDRVRWETGPNRGACAARNRGLALARGELIQFLDADDLLAPEKLSRMVPIALQHGPSCLPICDWATFQEGSAHAQRMGMSCVDDDPVCCCSRSGLQTASPLHWRQTLIAVGGFDETLPCAQERDLHLRLACHGLRFVHVPEVLVQVRRRAGSVSSDSIRVFRQHLRIVQRARHLLVGAGRCTDVRLAALAGLLARDARIFLRAGLHEDATEYFAAARGIHSEGGMPSAYQGLQRWAVRFLGPVLFERMVLLKRWYQESAAAIPADRDNT